MNPLTQLRPDIVLDSPEHHKLHEAEEMWEPQAPVQMEKVNSFYRINDDTYIDYCYRIHFMFDNSFIAWKYQSETTRDLDYTYLCENYVKMSW